MLKSSESYLVSIDVTESDEHVVIISRIIAQQIRFVKKLSGKEADEFVKMMTEKE